MIGHALICNFNNFNVALLIMTAYSHKGSFKNYVDKKRGEGSKESPQEFT